MNPNTFEKQNLRAKRRKKELVDYFGGCCEICGYDKNYAALEFHHRDPSTKKFQLDGRRLANTNINVLKEEAAKCILLCANCHRELHRPDFEKNKMNEDIQRDDIESVSVLEPKRRQAICPECGKSFDYAKGKIFCSKECREKNKRYPSKDEVKEKYEELKSQNKVAEYYGLTRRIIQRLLK